MRPSCQEKSRGERRKARQRSHSAWYVVLGPPARYGKRGRRAHIVEATNRGVGFPIDAPIETSPLYGGDGAAFAIYDIVRDHPTPVGSLKSIITDGDQVNAGDLEKTEAKSRKILRLKGRPRGSTTMPM